MASELTSTEAAERLLVSQPKICHLEKGNRATSPRDVRDLCAIYGVTDQQVIDSLMQMARESGQRGWWHPYGDLSNSVYIGLETDAVSLRAYEPMVVPSLLQTPAYAEAVMGETIPLLTVEQAAMSLKVRLRRQHRIYDLACPLRLWAVVDESALRRVVGSPDIMREQLEHLNALGGEPHIAVQVLPYTVGAHAGLSGQFSILQFADSPDAVVYLERFTSDLYLEKPSDVQHYSLRYDHLQAQALDPADSRDFITDAIKTYISGDQARVRVGAGRDGARTVGRCACGCVKNGGGRCYGGRAGCSGDVPGGAAGGAPELAGPFVEGSTGWL